MSNLEQALERLRVAFYRKKAREDSLREARAVALARCYRFPYRDSPRFTDDIDSYDGEDACQARVKPIDLHNPCQEPRA